MIQIGWSYQKRQPTSFRDLTTHPELTHWGQNQMSVILQMTIWNAYSWMKKFDFWLKSHWMFCSLGCNWQYTTIGSDNGLMPNRWQTIILSNDGLIYWHIYVPLSSYALHWHYYQSGTKPNLVAKISPPNLVTICAWLPKLVENISS